jgi:predicted transcriptional regulator
VSVADLVAELAESVDELVQVSDEELAELDRIAAAADEPGGTVSHEEVVRWLRTWGTPSYKPWGSR